MTNSVSPDQPPEIDASVPHSARIWNSWLGGKDNFPADRALGDAIAEQLPTIRIQVRGQRAFLGRAVRWLAGEAGVRQFLDIGTGIPSAGNVHEVAQEIAEIFDTLGGELNASTSREHTVLYARVPDDRLQTALDVMADMVYTPRFADLDAEREVVLEEIAMMAIETEQLGNTAPMQQELLDKHFLRKHGAAAYYGQR